jgi:NAD(P)-dependent dehydrogenase (short-subunit alcohol dehydrogenase family)
MTNGDVELSPQRSTLTAPEKMFRLDGRVAIVTGASSGLGERFAKLLEAAGASVIAAARRADRLDQLVTSSQRIYGFPCDITEPSAREGLIDFALEQGGQIDVLVNNAGLGGAAASSEEEPIEQFEQLIDVNLTSLFALAQRAGRQMIEQGSGSIINIASIYGLVGAADTGASLASYAASKGGVVNLTRQLGTEWARKGVRVNAIAPGFFPSEMTGDWLKQDETVSWVSRTTPLGRAGESHELDGALLLLASAAGSYITGHTIAVDGGWVAV